MKDGPTRRSLLIVQPHPAEGSLRQLGAPWELRPCSSLLGAIVQLIRTPAEAVIFHADAVALKGDALGELRRVCPDIVVVATTDTPTDVPGADECIALPCSPQRLARALDRAWEIRRYRLQAREVAEECDRLRAELARERTWGSLVRMAWQRICGAVDRGQAVTKAVLDVFADIARARRLSLMLVDDTDRGGLRIVQARGLSDQVVADTHLRMGEGVAGWVAQHGHTLASKPEPASPDANGTRAYPDEPFLSLPLKIGDEVVGVVNVTERIGAHAFSEEEVRQLEFLAGQIAVWMRQWQKIENAERLSLLDELTGLYNRRHFMGTLEREMDRARRNSETLGLAMIDIDHFKHYNDEHGHQAGDDLLRQFALVLQKNLRSPDIVCRYGGEEFAVILPRTGPRAEAKGQGSYRVIDRVRETVERFPFIGVDRKAGERLTMSAGVAVFPEDGESAEDLIAAADAFLYQAKEGGRNRVCARRRRGTRSPRDKNRAKT